MVNCDSDPNEQNNIYIGNTGYIFNAKDSDQWGNDSPIENVAHEINIDYNNNIHSITNTDFMVLYNGEWVTMVSVLDRLEKMEKFIEAFMGTFDTGITFGKIAEMRDIWNDNHDNTEDEWEIETAGAPKPKKMSVTIDPNYKLPSEENLLTNEDLEIDI